MMMPKHPVSEFWSAIFHFVFVGVYVGEFIVGVYTALFLLSLKLPQGKALVLLIPAAFFMFLSPMGGWFHLIGGIRHWHDRRQ